MTDLFAAQQWCRDMLADDLYRPTSVAGLFLAGMLWGAILLHLWTTRKGRDSGC